MTHENRAFSFKPVTNPNPQHLSQAQLDFYNREGYLTPFTIFTPAEALANRDYLNGLLEQAGDGGAYAINCYQARLKGVWDLCNDPRILDLVEDVIGPNIVCWASHYFCKMPHDKKEIPWHQDAIYWHLNPTRTVTVWLAIDDVDEDNSAMRFIPGSHNKGRLKTKTPEGPSVLHLETENAESMGTPISNNLAAGQISMHADMLLHSSKPNLSNRRRTGLTIRYCPPSVEIVDAKWEQGIEAIICRGEDPTGNWKHHERPETDVFNPKDGPRNIGGN